MHYERAISSKASCVSINHDDDDDDDDNDNDDDESSCISKLSPRQMETQVDITFHLAIDLWF